MAYKGFAARETRVKDFREREREEKVFRKRQRGRRTRVATSNALMTRIYINNKVYFFLSNEYGGYVDFILIFYGFIGRDGR